MKKTILALTALSLTFSSFTSKNMVADRKRKITSSEQMAQLVLTALQKSSVTEYVMLFPSLGEFQDVMKANSELYGTYLNDAQREFATNYDAHLLPAVKESFDILVNAGKSKGIDWKAIRLVEVKLSEEASHQFNSLPLTITFTSHGIEHKLQIERALVINGEWRISQFVKLV
jgi:hypothetical protein